MAEALVGSVLAATLTGSPCQVDGWPPTQLLLLSILVHAPALATRTLAIASLVHTTLMPTCTSLQA